MGSSNVHWKDWYSLHTCPYIGNIGNVFATYLKTITIILFTKYDQTHLFRYAISRLDAELIFFSFYRDLLISDGVRFSPRGISIIIRIFIFKHKKNLHDYLAIVLHHNVGFCI